jgi:hypothetical protein
MKKWMAIAAAALTLGVAQSASAGWNDNWGGGNGYNDYPVWTPMYWMDEMFNNFDDNGYGNNTPWGWNRGGNRGYNNNGYYPQQGYGYPQGAYPQPSYSPYGYAPQQQAPVYQQSPYGYAPYGYAPQQGQQQAAPTNR